MDFNEEKIRLEYVWSSDSENGSNNVRDLENSFETAGKSSVVIEEQDEIKSKFDNLDNYIDARPSNIFSSTLEFSKDSIIFENDEVYFAKEIDFQWLSDKLSNIGKIEWIRDFEELINGDTLETYQQIMTTVHTVEQINEKLEDYIKESFVTNSSRLVPSNWLKLTGSDTEFARPEIIRILKLIAINSELEQPERMLLLIFILKFACDQWEIEMFTQVVKFFYHLSELRRFNDSLLFTLDDINYFGTYECDILFETLDSDFFNEQVPKHTQLLYISFLANIWWWWQSRASEKFDQYFDTLWNRLNPIIDWENLINTQDRNHSVFMNSSISSFRSKSYENGDSYLKRLPVVDASSDPIKYLMIPFISLVKLWHDKSKFDQVLKDYKVIDQIYCKSDFKNSIIGCEDTSKSLLEIENNLIKTFRKYNVKFKQLDEIVWRTDLNLLKYFKPWKGYSIKLTATTESRGTEYDGFWFNEESESEKTILRDTETTFDFHKTRAEDFYQNSNVLSMHVNIESRFGTEGNPSIVSHNINSLRKGNRRDKIGNSSWKPCWIIF